MTSHPQVMEGNMDNFQVELLQEPCILVDHKENRIGTARNLDHTQVELLQEPCILVDHEDNRIGTASKKDCHLMRNIKAGETT